MPHPHPRQFLITNLRWLCIAALIAALVPTAMPSPTAYAAGEFTNSGIVLPGVAQSSVAWGDYDNDGDLDILLTGCYTGGGGLCSSSTARIYRNDGGGTFTDINAGLTGVYDGAVAWGDYDNDNDLDILLTGQPDPASATYIAKIYRNEGSGQFTDINAALAGITIGSVAWGDYDNDGDLDIALSGCAGFVCDGSHTSIYRNDGPADGSGWRFTDINSGLPGLYSSSVAWGDSDNDGDLDLLLTGNDPAIVTHIVSKVYRNDGGGVFTDIQAPLAGIQRGSAAWGDYDTDGDLDILLVGCRQGYGGGDCLSYIAKVYRNDGGNFTDINAPLSGAYYSSAAWGDYNNDGRLDILLAGTISGFGSTNISKVYRNEGGDAFTDINAGLSGTWQSSVAWGDYDGDKDLDILLTGEAPGYVTKIYRNNTSTPNTISSAPTGLGTSAIGTSAAISWGAASDAQTPANGLTYNLRFGTTSGGSQIAGPMSRSNGYHLVPQPGNVQHGLTTTITNLWHNATYYWSVQAIDTAFAGSPFAQEASFTMPPPTVNFSNGAYSVKETANSAPITVTLSGPSVVTVTVNYATSNGTALAGSDYLTTTGTLTFTPGVTIQTFSVSILDDALIDSNEAVTLTLSDPAYATLGTPNPATLTIVDNDSLVRFSDSAYSANEGTGTALIRATLNATPAYTITVDYATANGTALSGSDYAATTSVLTFIPGITSTTFTVPLVNDALDELTETIQLTLSNPNNATLGTPNPATLAIIDDDPPPAVRFSNSAYNGYEGSGAALITAGLSAASALTVTVDYATGNGTALAGSDYLTATGTLTFTPGVTTRTFSVPIVDDVLLDPNETVALTLISPLNATLGTPNPAMLTIVDDDPVVRFSNSAYNVNEGAGTAIITATLNAAPTLTATVNYATFNNTATAGSDYLAVSGTLTFTPGVTTTTFTVSIINDAIGEGNETAYVYLYNPVNATAGIPNPATLTILDDDPILTVRFSDSVYSASEAANTATITATLSPASSLTVTVNYSTANGTATAGSDYVATSGMLTFTPGVTFQTFSVPLINDALDEANETIRLTLSNSTSATLGTPNPATLMIVDDDPLPSVQFTSSTLSVNEYARATSITAELSTPSGLTITVDYTTVNGTALAGSDYLTTTGTLTFMPGIETQTFSVPIINDGLDETDEALTLALSNPGNATLGTTDSAVLTIIDNDPVAPLIVTKAEDTNDSLCSLADCSLREAIMIANTAPGDDIILVPAGVYTLTLGELGVSSDVTVNGAGAASTVIDGNGTNRVFNITGDVIVTFQDMSLTGGRPGLDSGGAILNNGGTLTLVNTRLANNHAFNGGGGLLTFAGNVTLINSTVMSNVAEIGGGAGILNYGSGPLNIVNSVIVGNQAYGAYYGGGIWSQGPLTVTGSLIANNSAEFGGGVFNSDSLFASDSVFSGNGAHFGGGIESRSDATLTRVQLVGNSAGDGGGGGMRHLGGVLLRDSMVVSNTTSGAGGGVAGGVGSWAVVNTTFSGNQASSGGAIVNNLSTESTRLALNNVTIANNIAMNGVGGLAGNRVDFKNTILAGNTGIIPDCSGPLTSQGYNLIQDMTGCVILGDLTGNLTGVLAGLGPLQDNGGATFTHALLPGSPAMEAGNPATPGSGGNACEVTDQRDVIRPQGLGCDIGAYEAFASAVIAPNSGGTITMTSSITTTISFPPGAVAQPITVTVQLTTSQPVSSGLLLVGEPFVVEARDTNDTPVTTFSQSFTITISYDDADVAGMDEASLKLYFWEANAGQWVEIPTSVDTVANTLTANVDHLTTFALLGQAAQQLYLPLILK